MTFGSLAGRLLVEQWQGVTSKTTPYLASIAERTTPE